MTRHYRRLLDILLFCLSWLGLIWLVLNGSEQLGYSWHWHQIPGFLGSFDAGGFRAGPLVRGLVVTLKITGTSLLLAAAIGLISALLRLSGSPVARTLAAVYVESIRNTPLLVHIFFLYFVMAPILDIGRFATAVLALSLFEGAYACEIIRAGIVSLQRGQWEAAYSLGLSRFDTYRTVILPQAIKRVLPPLTSQAISLIKDSALVSTIAVYDLTMEGRTIIAETFLTFEVWFSVAALYLMLTLCLSGGVALLEQRFGEVDVVR
ncbi:MAG: polar amino acid ABC transporter permease [Desulfobulbus propionicus]|nr:MAG: polar amino acid ABC transporter permease [Desulfobulbus propionicus]